MPKIKKNILAPLCLAFAILLTFSACGGAVKEQKSFFAMDTYMTVTVYGKGAKDNLAIAETLIKELDERYSVTSESGEVYAVNLSGELSDISAGLAEMIEKATLMYERTNGAYDITSRPISELWGFADGKDNRVPTDEEIAETLELIGMDKLSLEGDKLALSNGMKIDLGSCAKGYAAREAAALLKENGVTCAVLSLGGNVQTLGAKPDGTLFSVAIADPRDPSENLGVLRVGECAVVTSGTYQRYFEANGKKYHHIFDLRNGRPCENGLLSVTVVCEDGLWADILSTSLLLLGKDGALEYYRTYGGFEAVIVSSDGTVTVTEGLKNDFTLIADYISN